VLEYAILPPQNALRWQLVFGNSIAGAGKLLASPRMSTKRNIILENICNDPGVIDRMPKCSFQLKGWPLSDSVAALAE
jgi:hypothetical protein